MKSSILMSVVVVSNVFGVFGTPFAAQPNPTSSIAAPTGTATSSAINHHIVRDTQPLFACLASSDSTVEPKQGVDQQSTATDALNACGDSCFVQCVEGGCVAGASGVGSGPTFFGTAIGSGQGVVDGALAAAFNNCTSSQASCLLLFLVCSSDES
jgi:hypothetical protein